MTRMTRIWHVSHGRRWIDVTLVPGPYDVQGSVLN